MYSVVWHVSWFPLAIAKSTGCCLFQHATVSFMALSHVCAMQFSALLLVLLLLLLLLLSQSLNF